MQRIYLDYAATTPVRPEALEAMLPFFAGGGFNPSSVHAEGRAARAALDDARARIAATLGAKPKEIVFTGSGSEANNLAIIGCAEALRDRGRHLISLPTEHHSVLHALAALRDRGWEVTLLPVDSNGMVTPQDLTAALRPETALVTIAYANNEIGTIAPIAQLAAIAHEHGTIFHTDAIQTPAHLTLDVRQLGADLLSIAAHKFEGPKGVGALYAREGTPLQPLIHGGGQELGKRAGTENVAGISGMAKALELAQLESVQNTARVSALRDALEAHISAEVDGVRVNGARHSRLPNNLNLSFLGIASDQLLARLDLEGLAISAGSACTSGVVEPSHVIAALGVPPDWAVGTVRLSLGRSTTAGEVETAGKMVVSAVRSLRESFGFSNQAERGILGWGQGTPGRRS